MALQTHMGGNLPNGTENGLEDLTEVLLRDRHTTRTAIITFDVQSVKENVRKGTTEPTIGIRHIEPVAPGSDEEATLRALLEARYTSRTGERSLPTEGDPTAAELDLPDTE